MQRHPFDARRSGRDPFPCFATAMAVAASDSERGSDSGSDSDCRAGRVRSVAGGCTCDGAADGDDHGSFACGCERLPTPSTSPHALDWSIDGLATLLPRAFSPLPTQKRPLDRRSTRHRLRRRRRWSTGTTSALSGDDTLTFHEDEQQEETPLRSATFFEDEAQFGVLRTPADVIEREQQQQHQQGKSSMAVGVSTMGEYAAWRTASAESTARWRELHRRCVDTIQVCEARVRERQQRLARLPIPATKLALRHRSKRYGTGSHSASMNASTSSFPQSNSGSAESAERIPRSREPLTPVAPTRLSFGSIDLSPIPQDSAQKALLSVHDTTDPKTPTPTTRANAPSISASGGASALSSPALSSIAEHASEVLTPSFASLRFSPSRELDASVQADEEDKENASAASSSSLRTVSLLRGSPPAGSASSASSSSSPSVASPFSPLSGGDERHEAESIAARQLSFIAAIEEEAQERDAAASRYQRRSVRPTEESSASGEDGATVSPSPTRTPLLAKCPPPATSMASIYKEARALGLTEPTAQWEYVQLIRRQTTRDRKAPNSRVSF